MLILVLVLVLKDSLRTFFKSLSLSWSLWVRSLSLSLSLGVRSRRSLSLSWSCGLSSLSLWSSPCPCPCLWSLQRLVSIIPLFRFIRIIYYIVLSTHTISFNNTYLCHFCRHLAIYKYHIYGLSAFF